MIKNNEDLFAFVRALADELRRKGMQRETVALSDALSISTVPGEVLGEIRTQLVTLRLVHSVEGLWVRDGLREALSYLERVLR